MKQSFLFIFTIMLYGSVLCQIQNLYNFTDTTSGLDIEMIFVRGGKFQMGSNNGQPDEAPVHTVTINNLYIGKYEVTLEQFKQFVDETGYRTTADLNGGSEIYTGKKWEKRQGVNWQCDTKGNIRPKSNTTIRYCMSAGRMPLAIVNG